MSILRLTEKGKGRFIDFIDSLRGQDPQEFPQDLLVPSEYAEVIGGDRSWLDDLDLDNALEAAKALDEIVNKLKIVSAERDWGFWSWCAAYLFGRLCKRKDGKLAPGEISIWIAELPTNYKRYYRHYLASIWQVYRAHPDKEKEMSILLSRKVNTPGELWAQIAATQTLITNKSMIDAVYHLYWDEQTGLRKYGAGGNSPRRLTQVLKQFERTYDFFSMTGGQIVEILPSEFDKFK